MTQYVTTKAFFVWTLLILSTFGVGQFVYGQATPSQPQSAAVNSPTDLAQRQLNAYNAHDLDAFLEPYADDVEIYDFPNELKTKGKEAMRKRYEFLTKSPMLHCELVNRIVVGNTVIDHERITNRSDRPPFEAVAIYKIENGKIQKVYFTR
ncbi:MAG: steroid delta-isomerase [Cytophagales bacterium]|nr:MAG: steroid delta-isomerase [Cytophagales bacterium]